jgi:FlaA1/EpsC-like NDP-sugar epimerase
VHDRSLSRTDRRYRKQAFYRRKFEYVAKCMERGEQGRGRRMRIWGAGTNGRRLASHLLSSGRHIDAFVDVDPRLVGTQRRGVPVLSPEAVGRADADCWYLCVVGSWGARETIRQALRAKGKIEEIDFTIL